MLTLLSVPPTGGDTAWTSQTAAYARLSQPIKTLLEGLRAEHTGVPQADGARRNGNFVRREPVVTQHPIVRVHPVGRPGFGPGPLASLACLSGSLLTYDLLYFQVTGQKSLFVNATFTKRIVGLKHEESEALLKLLYTVSHANRRSTWPRTY